MKYQILSVVALTAILLGTAYIATTKTELSAKTVNQFTTVRKWNVCQLKAGVPCEKLSTKEHAKCYDALIDTNNCMLRDTQSCIDFFDFVYDPNNADEELPQVLNACLDICDQYADENINFENWFDEKFYTCTEAS